MNGLGVWMERREVERMGARLGLLKILVELTEQTSRPVGTSTSFLLQELKGYLEDLAYSSVFRECPVIGPHSQRPENDDNPVGLDTDSADVKNAYKALAELWDLVESPEQHPPTEQTSTLLEQMRKSLIAYLSVAEVDKHKPPMVLG